MGIKRGICYRIQTNLLFVVAVFHFVSRRLLIEHIGRVGPFHHARGLVYGLESLGWIVNCRSNCSRSLKGCHVLSTASPNPGDLRNILSSL